MRLYLFISTVPAMEHRVHDNLKPLPELIEVMGLFGEYDIEAAFETECVEEVVDRVRRINGVTDMKILTCRTFKNPA